MANSYVVTRKRLTLTILLLVFLPLLVSSLGAGKAYALIYIPTTTSLGFGNGYYLSFTDDVTCTSYSQVGGYLIFLNLTLKGVNTNVFNFTSSNTVLVSSANSNWVNYTVVSGGTQVFWSPVPKDVYINGVKTGSGWSYSGGKLTVTGATSSVAAFFAYEYSGSWTVSASSDDCTSDTTVSYMQPLTNNWIGFPRDSTGASDRQLGARWLGINIPQGATITSANITGHSYGTYSATTNSKIRGELTGSSATFSTYTNFIARTRTSAGIDWDDSSTWSSGQVIVSPSIITVIQEIVNQGSWSSGNALSIFIANDGTSGTNRRNFRSWDYSGNTFGLVLKVSWTYTEIDVTGLGGMSGYLPNTGWVDSAITQMALYNCTIFRMSFNPSWDPDGNPYNATLVQYYLDNTPDNWIVIVDRNHLYPYGAASDAAFIANIETAKDNLNTVCASWPNNSRVYVELVNEFTGALSYVQACMNHVRSAGYNNYIVWNRMYTGTWSSWQLVDPLDKWFQGMHFYFNTWSPSGAIAQMQSALAYGPVINTEIGADYNEGGAFTNATVEETNQFVTWCQSNGVANCIWQSGNPLGNTNEYNAHGFNWFSGIVPPPPPPPPPSDIILIDSIGWTELYEAPILAGYLTEHHPSPDANTSAHGFNIYCSSNYYLTNITLSLAYSPSEPTALICVKIYDAASWSFSALPSGSALGASNQMNSSDLSATWGIFNFTFSTPFYMTGGHFYSVVLETYPSGGIVDDTHRVYVQFYNTTNADYVISMYQNSGWLLDEPATMCRFIAKIYGLAGPADTFYWVYVYNGVYGTTTHTGLNIEHSGGQMLLTATPMNASFVFNYWQINSVKIGPNPYLFTFNQNATVTPVFKLIGAGGSAAPYFDLWPIFGIIGVVGIGILIISRRKQ